jgi:SAM-dependent methyltransferase
MNIFINNNKKIICPVCESKNLCPYKIGTSFELTKCIKCNLVFSSITPTEEDISKYYEKYAYEGISELSPITTIRFHEWLAKFESFRKLNNILDVGCGRGEFLEEAQKIGWNVIGSEYSETAVKILKEKKIPTISGDIVEYLTDKYFDVIVSIEVIEHLRTPLQNIEKMFSLLRPGGLLFLTTPNRKSLTGLIIKSRWRVFEYPEHLFYFSIGSMEKLLIKVGFREIKIITTGISPTAIKNGIFKKDKTTLQSEEEFRGKTESNIFFAFLKKTINLLLNIFKKGDTLKIWAVK